MRLPPTKVEERHWRETILAEEAAAWFVRLIANDLSRPEWREYMRWLRRSGHHVQALLDIHRYHGYGRKVGLHHRCERHEGYREPHVARNVEPRPADGTSAVLRPSAYCTTDQWLRAAVITQLYPADQGLVISADPIQFSTIVKDLERDPRLVHQIHWRKWEELVAAAYEREGFQVVLTPRSNDGGRDVIATRADIGTIKIYDQVKALSPNRLVTATDVRAMLCVLCAEPNVSKGFVTTRLYRSATPAIHALST